MEPLKKEALRLYKKGYTTREVAEEVKKSHAWVWRAIRDLDTNPTKGKKKES